MITVSIISLIIGIFFLVLAFVFDHEHDFNHDHSGPSLFNTKVIATFLTAFGALGIILRHNNVPTGYATGASAVGGILIGLVMFWLLSFVHKQESNTHVGVQKLLGAKGVVSVTIEADGLGEIMLNVGGTYLARSEGQAIQTGSEVEVIKNIGDILLVRSRQH